jgi:signal transduction histidine kinase
MAVGRFLEAAGASLSRRRWTARRATHGTAGDLSNYSSQHRVDRFIAGTRLAFTLCALLAIVIDPSEPARNVPRVLALVVAYSLYSLATTWWAWSTARSLGERARLATQVIDVGVAVALMCLSGGTNSPFFSFMVFPLLSASLRWRWRGALWTGAFSLAAFGAVGLYTVLGSGGGRAVELNSFIIEAVYLVIVTLVLAYLAAHDERVRREMGTLATWTTAAVSGSDGRLADVLSHVASVVDAPRVLLVWQAADQLGLTLAHWTGVELRSTEESPLAFEPLVAGPLGDSDFVCSDAAEPVALVLCVARERSWRWRGAPLGEQLRSAFSIHAVIAVCLSSGSLRGRLFILDKPAATSDDLVLATIVARQVENALEHDHLARQLRGAALAQERARIARDVHDGALQSLTGAALRLETIRRQLEDDPAAALDGLHELQTLIMLQQRELRSWVRELQTGGCADASGLADLLTELALRIEQEWKLTVKLNVKLQPGRFDAAISSEVAREIQQLLREALVNAARHTLASLAHVTVALDGDSVRITVADNGQGFPFQGRFEYADLAEGNLGPVMLRQRIAALGGTLAIDSSEAGARLEITLPRRIETRSADLAGSRLRPPSPSASGGPPSPP